jgi:hypothetical protein
MPVLEEIMKPNNGVFRQRVGALIEQYICERYELFFNKRQHTKGFYDAYKDGSIFEIKAARITHKEFVLLDDNHAKLVRAGGSYIFVTYDMVNHDSQLRVISDIKILDVYIIKAQVINTTLQKHATIKTVRNRVQLKIGLERIKSVSPKQLNPTIVTTEKR